MYEKSLNIEGILEEARFFGVQEMIDKLGQLVECSTSGLKDPPLTRQDVIRALIQTPYQSELRFQVS